MTLMKKLSETFSLDKNSKPMYNTRTELKENDIEFSSFFNRLTYRDYKEAVIRNLGNRIEGRKKVLISINDYFKETGLQEKGVKAYLAGGAIRDLALKYPKQDYNDNDIFITNSKEIQSLYEDFDLLDVFSFVINDTFGSKIELVGELGYGAKEQEGTDKEPFNVFEVPNPMEAGRTQFIFRMEPTIEEIVDGFHWELVKGYYDVEADSYYFHEEMEKALETKEVKVWKAPYSAKSVGWELEVPFWENFNPSPDDSQLSNDF